MNPHQLLPTLPRVATSAEWYAYYLANAEFQLKIPWERGAEITKDKISAIADSLAIWQLGEASDGSHLLAATKNYAQVINDPLMTDVVYLFIKIEIWSTPVIMVETLALIYYKAIQKATKSTVLYLICQQILRDEVKHIRFQYERFASMHRNRPLSLRLLTHLLHRILYLITTLAVWVGHHKALQAGGYNFKSYWREAWIKMNFAWRRVSLNAGGNLQQRCHMNPERYEWKNCSLESRNTCDEICASFRD